MQKRAAIVDFQRNTLCASDTSPGTGRCSPHPQAGSLGSGWEKPGLGADRSGGTSYERGSQVLYRWVIRWEGR